MFRIDQKKPLSGFFLAVISVWIFLLFYVGLSYRHNNSVWRLLYIYVGRSYRHKPHIHPITCRFHVKHISSAKRMLTSMLASYGNIAANPAIGVPKSVTKWCAKVED